MLDDLRRSTTQDDFDFEEEDDSVFVVEEDPEERVNKLFLGMTAVERMFLSIFLFLNVCVLGLALLLATGRIVF
ncbi:MAG: hypothetical protein HZC41_20565 [Chloroflexi bacterium]|nr:hypothetical protein [Chloroflexota bacterium]